MKPTTRRAILAALAGSLEDKLLVDAIWVKIAAPERGEWNSNAPRVLAALRKQNPQFIAAELVAKLNRNFERNSWPLRVEEANGFLNFRLDDHWLNAQLLGAIQSGARYGSGNALNGRRINVEFVSADPTGPLLPIAGRIACQGEALCRLLEAQGARVTREFFLNDDETSSKMRLLGDSVGAWYRAEFEPQAAREARDNDEILADAWVRDLARRIVAQDGNVWLLRPENESAKYFAHQARETVVARQKATLDKLGVHFAVWTSETALHGEGRVRAALDRLRGSGHTYERDGTLWLRTTSFGDQSDRALLRADNRTTYLATDIAYHIVKWSRGFDTLINIWTSEHRPYIARTKAALRAAGADAENLEVIVSEGVRLRQDGTPVNVGKSGGSIALDDLLENIEADALKYFFSARSWDDRVEIETELATRDDESNPAYGVRLLPSRLGTLIRELEAHAVGTQSHLADDFNGWSEADRELRRLIALWPDEAETAALRREPERVARFAYDLSKVVRDWLSQSPSASSLDQSTLTARLTLLRAARVVATNALQNLGIQARDNF